MPARTQQDRPEPTADAPAAVDPAGGPPEHPPGRTRARLLAIATTVLVLAFAKWAAMAVVPLVFGVFLVVLLWPLQERLERRLPRRLAYLVTVLVLFAILAGFAAGLFWSGQRVLERGPEYAQRLEEIAATARARAAAQGISLPAGGVSAETVQRLISQAAALLTASVSTIALILAFAVLALIEVHTFHDKAKRAFRHRRHGRTLIDSAERLVAQYQRLLGAMAVAAVLQGVTVWLFCLLVGLDFALVWALLAMLLNFVPTIGSILAVIPPTLFALVQFDGGTRPLLVLAGMAVVQLVMGNFVDPKIAGRFLSLSPLVVLFAIVFWGWLWGVPGALLGMPIMVAVAIVADEFPQTRWLSAMMMREPRTRSGSAGADPA